MTKTVEGAEALVQRLRDKAFAGKLGIAGNEAADMIAALVAENERLRGLHEDLQPYTSHHIGCALYQQSWASGAPRCSCGLDAIRAIPVGDDRGRA